MTKLKYSLFLLLPMLLCYCATPEPTLQVDPPIQLSDASENALLNNTTSKSVAIITNTLKPTDKEVTLPWPPSIQYVILRKFMDEYKPAYEKFGNLSQEYRHFFLSLNDDDNKGEEVKTILKQRINENLERAHWLFCFGIIDVIEYLMQNNGVELASDKEINFIARMKVISFLSQTLSANGKNTNYKNLTKEVYISLNKRYFNRTILPRKAPGR